MENREGVCYAKGETEAFNGTALQYREDGSKEYEIPYVDGKVHGTVIEYNSDGSKETEIPYVKGNWHGTQILYREDGSKKSEIVYKKGGVISRKNF